jgi:hypothetical protein
MADMGQSHDAGKPCPMPVVVSCCQSLPSCVVRATDGQTVATAEDPPLGPLAALISRFVAPEPPPPKA